METTIEKIPTIQKLTFVKKNSESAAQCCTPKSNETICCTPNEAPQENSGACGAQPEDGSSCCNK